MEKRLKYLLSTRPLSKSIVEAAAEKGVQIDIASFIDVQQALDDETTEKIAQLGGQQHTVIFTSMNAVDAVATVVQNADRWKVYSIGNTTRQLIEKYWGASCIVATAENSQRLGERLIDDGVNDVVFFCGNIRRHELPNKIKSEGGSVEEVVVYHTLETPVALDKHYDGILFFSPSAATSFYKSNRPSNKTVLFAIGNTTADALRQQGGNNIKKSSVTDKNSMVEEAVEFLASKP